MNFFVRQPKPEELAKFKKLLNTWSEQKTGALESKLGDKSEIKSCKACEVYSVSLETLIEDRTTELATQPQKKNQLALTPTVAHGSFNVWNKPSPPSLSMQFQEMTVAEEIPGTEYYSGCKTCQEKGHTDCTTCQKAGKLICGDCNGQKKVDCPSCNGYGVFDCNSCVQGFVEIDCSVCDKGEVKCNGCGGSGRHDRFSSNAMDCRLCNGSGHTRCISCGGKGEETVPCVKCKAGVIPCQTCRTQKIVECQACDPKGHVTCHKCKGQTVLSCTPCNSQGGFRHVEKLVYKTSIESNELTVSPLEKIRDKIRLTFQEHATITDVRLAMDIVRQNVSDQELLGPVEQIMNHVSQNRPNSTLLEKLSLKKAIVLDVEYTYEGQKGHSYFDYESGLLLVDVNPLENKISDSKERLKKSYAEAKSAQNIPKARSIIQEAQKLKLKDLAAQWKQEIDTIENKIRSEEASHFIKTVRNPVLLAFGPVFWLMAGFFTPLSLTLLIGFTFMGFYHVSTSSKDLAAGKEKHQKELVSKVKTFGTIYLVITLLGLTVTWYSTTNSTERAFKLGAPLSGDAP